MTVGTLAEVMNELERCKKTYPDSYPDQKIIRVLFQAKDNFEKERVSQLSLGQVNLTQEQVNESFRKGEIINAAAKLNKEAFLDFLALISNGIAGLFPQLATQLEDLSAFVRDKLKDCGNSVDSGKIEEFLNYSYAEMQVTKDFATFIFSFIISSLYQWHLPKAMKEVNTKLWTKGQCPVCGKAPHYGMLREEDGALVLECWQCATRWVYSRLKCPFCETTNHNDLSYFTTGSNDLCRIYICRKCQKYYKVFDFRERKHNHIVLFVYHLATLQQDVLAVLEGFQPGSSLQWVNEEELLLLNTRGNKSHEIN